MSANLKQHAKGITLIEILMVLGVLAILVSFAAPSFNTANSAMQMRAASEQVEYSIDLARKTARMTETPVIMNVSIDPKNGQHRITYSLSDKARKKLSQPSLQEFRLDSSLAFQVDHRSFEFNSRGIVTNPGTLTLIAKDEETGSTSFLVE